MTSTGLLLCGLAVLAWYRSRSDARARPRGLKHVDLKVARAHLHDPPPRWVWQTGARGPLLALAILSAHVDVVAALSRPPVWAMLAALLLVAVYLPQLADLGWALARKAIARGYTRLAYRLAKLSATTWREDREGGAVLAAAWASYAKPTFDPDDTTWVEDKLHKLPSLAGAGVVAQGLLAANRGDRDQARTLMHSAASLRNDDTPAYAMTVAWDWLIADAAADGRWHEVIRIAAQPLDLSPTAKLLAAIAARLDGQPSPPDINLKALWLAAGKHRQTLPWRDRALSCKRVLYRQKKAAQPATQTPAEVSGSDLQKALGLHAQLRREGPVWLRLRPKKLAELVAAWERVFAGKSLLKQLQRRIIRLEAPLDGAEVIARYRRQICEDIANFAQAAEVSLVDAIGPHADDSFAAQAVYVLRSRLLVHVEQLSDTLHNRVRSGREKLPIDEWREWTQLRESCEHATRLGGMDARRVLFPQVHKACCAHAVWLWNERKQYAMAMPMFRWLLQEAEAVGDEAAIELQRKNAEVKH